MIIIIIIDDIKKKKSKKMVVMGFEPMISQILSLEPLTTRSKQPYYLYYYQYY